MTLPSQTSIRPIVAYAAIALVWVLTRAYPLSQAIPWQFWEIWEAKKLLEYGFWARQGGIINVHFMTGLLDSPERFNYVNHPYPILWIFTLCYHLFGAWGALLMGSLIGLISAAAVYPALQLRFTQTESLLGTMLFLLAPTTILMDVNPNIIALGAIGWPFLMLALAKLEKGFTWGSALLLTAIIFVLGQISWFTYTVSAAIFGVLIFQIWVAKPESPTWRKTAVLSLLIGSMATLAVMLFQIYYYTFDLSEVIAYARGQAGSEAAVPPLRMAFGIILRTILSAGPALLLGGALGVIILARRHTRHWLELIAFLYLLVFAVSALLLPRFFLREVTMYEYLIFPLVAMTLSAIQAIQNRVFTLMLLAISVCGLAYPVYQASIPVVSQTSRNLSTFIRGNTDSREILATNLESQKMPFESWDVGSRSHTTMIADRMMRWGINNKTTLENIPNDFKVTQIDVTYILSEELTVSEELRDFLSKETPVKTIRVELPPEPPSFATEVRSVYWKLVGKHQVAPAGDPESPILNLKFYRLTLTAPQQ